MTDTSSDDSSSSAGERIRTSAKKKNINKTAKVFTFTRYAADDEEKAKWLTTEDMPISIPIDTRFLKCQLEECPKTGRYHLQGHISFYKSKRRNAVKAMIGHNAHVEYCHNELSSERYCGKDETRVRGPWTYGEPCRRGRRTDWQNARALVEQGKTDAEIYTEIPHLVSCTKGVEKLKSLFGPKPPLTRDVRVIMLWGKPGTGKTHRARTTYPDAFVITGTYYEGKSFDTYDNQTTLILDEWKQGEWPLTLMNAILDKWQLTLQCRYQNKQAAWTTVVICTNQDPMNMYGGDAAFGRRIKDRTIEVLSQDDPIIDLKTF